MTPEDKASILEALRSGRFKQARERLRTPEGYCCLGVMAETLELCKWVPVITYSGDSYVALFYDQEHEHEGDLPTEVVTRLGLDAIVHPSTTREILDRANIISSQRDWGKGYLGSWIGLLTCFNDQVGFTFTQIADVIEEYL